MAATEAVVWAGFAVFNLALAWLVGSVRPRRLPQGVAALLFASNGLAALAQLAASAGLALDPREWLTFLLNLVSLATLLALPFLFPRRRLSRRGERALLAGAGAAVLLLWAFAIGYALRDALPPLTGALYGLNTLLQATNLFQVLYFGVPALGAVLLLDAYLGARSSIQREQARFFLAAYAMKVALNAAAFDSIAWLQPFAAIAQAAEVERGLAWAGVLVALLAVPLGLAASWLRARRDRGPARPLREDAFILAFLGLGALLALLPGGAELEYLFVRPLLFAYGILHYRILDVDLRDQRLAVAAGALAGLASVFAAVFMALQAVGVDSGIATGMGTVATLGAAGAFALPLARVLLREPSRTDARGRDLYMAALEEAVSARDGHDTSGDRVLRALRARLQISEREHAVMEAAVRALYGQAPEGLAAGELFLGRYRVEKLLGEGGFGRTFLARDEQVRRGVVLKVTRRSEPEETRRLLHEARLVARLQHPHVVAVHDVEEVAGACILVMEHVDGGSLADRLRRGPLPLREALRIMDDVLAALEAAHAEGIVHRDVKPANILLTRGGRAKLADFGVARALDGGGTTRGFSLDGRDAGSLHYMAPEQARGREADPRTDLYAVGAVLYECLAGRPYLDFRGKAEFDARLTILEERPALPLPGAPRAVSALLADALAKDPAARPASAAVLRRRLAALAATRG